MIKYSFGAPKAFTVPSKSIFAPASWRNAYEELKGKLCTTYNTRFKDIAYTNKGGFERLTFTMRLDNTKFSTTDVRNKLSISYYSEIDYVIYRDKQVPRITMGRDIGFEHNYCVCMNVESKVARVITSPMELLADMMEIHNTREATINAWYLKNRNMNMDMLIEYGETTDTVVGAFEAEGFTCVTNNDTTIESSATRTISLAFKHAALLMSPALRISINPTSDYKFSVYCDNHFTQELVANMMTGYYPEGRNEIYGDNWVRFNTYEDGMTVLKALPKVFRKIGESMQLLKKLSHPYQYGKTED